MRDRAAHQNRKTAKGGAALRAAAQIHDGETAGDPAATPGEHRPVPPGAAPVAGLAQFLVQPGFARDLGRVQPSQPASQPGAPKGLPRPERQGPPAPRRTPMPPAPVRRVPPRRQPKGR
ncbi:hypothetical protein Sru01_47730 [Sphaerisporangium rufum]|uniref:Uncharacterized protein n=1 Tax=Sphaerisporangium rufum TaxID=1381558 RepID=A0A919R4Z9_9ACTN|nr:hypothetical protein [Sphaerisporangium rufum]GII79791.1 hypothetical protein Sru01_47730 [Sphaerisporangium rufum]